MTASDTPKSAGAMMSDILGNVSNLLRNETDLARAEIGESLKKAAVSLEAMAVAMILAITGLNVLSGSLVTLLVLAGLEPHWATVIVGAGFLLLALAVFVSARSALNQIGFMPTRAARNVQRDVATVKESFNDK